MAPVFSGRSFGRLRAVAALAMLVLVVFFAAGASAEAAEASGAALLLPPLGANDLNDRLQDCAVVQALGRQKLHLHRHGDSGGSGSAADAAAAAAATPSAKLFAVLFPGSPAVNALLATLYISGPPNLLLALCPPNIDPASLSVMVAFAVGGLLGDTLFHLLPEIFVGEDDARADRARLVLVEPNRNLLLGVAILAGFVTFVAMDKGLRIATGGGGHDHGHDHGHGEKPGAAAVSAASTTSRDLSGAGGAVKGRKKAGSKASAAKAETAVAVAATEPSASVKLSGYLNLIADFTHNITDGLAMAASFYASPTIGATTTVAVFFHEIPHEVGDFALLVQSGFSKRAAMGAQFVTALGALLGTGIGILVQELGGAAAATADAQAPGAAAGALAGTGRGGLLGTSLAWGDLLLPFTAGTFLYVGTVAVIPELLQTDVAGSSGGSKLRELRKTLVQFAAIAAGAGIMLYISWD